MMQAWGQRWPLQARETRSLHRHERGGDYSVAALRSPIGDVQAGRMSISDERILRITALAACGPVGAMVAIFVATHGIIDGLRRQDVLALAPPGRRR
jgi:hypothetical protein